MLNFFFSLTFAFSFKLSFFKNEKPSKSNDSFKNFPFLRNDNLKEKANVRLKKKFNITNKRSERGNKNKNRRRANINVNASDIKLTVKERQKFMHKRKFNVLRN